MSINTNMLSKLMLYRITTILIAPVLSGKRGVGIETETQKSSSSHYNQVTFVVTRAITHNSASALERETATCFLVFQAMSEPSRKTQ
jgi:hypothetical protein